MSSVGLSGLDPSLLLSYYQTQLTAGTATPTATATAGQTSSATANDVPPWTETQPSQIAEQAKVLNTTDFLDTSNVPLSAGATSDSKLEQDNQKLFSLYNAVNSLAELAQMAQSSTATSGQLVGLNNRFQTGLSQIEQYLSTTTFNNYTLQTATPAASETSTAGVSLPSFSYTTGQFIDEANIDNPVPGLSTADSFTIGVTKGGQTTDVPIDLSQVQGPLTLNNIIIYINSQLSADGFSTRFQKNQQGGTATSDDGATYGLTITPGANETISFSAASTPALYMAGNSGSATEVDTTTGTGSSAKVDTTAANQSGRLTKIGDLSGTPSAILTASTQSTSGTTTAAATAVDSDGNIYVLGNATGDMGNELNQGSQDVYLTKYDSAGHVLWQQLVGSAGSASGYGLALDPSGGVVISGSSTADLTTTSIAEGNTDSFVARYDADGDQLWIKQVQTLADNQAATVSVDASGNVYIGGSVSGYPVANSDVVVPNGVIGAGQSASGGGSDAYLAKFDANGNLLAENQFGTSGADQVSATATGSDGSLYVASVQNGEAIVAKYANGDISSAPVWTEDLGPLSSGGAIGGLAVSGDQVYVSGTTSNADLTANGQASIASASSGGTDAFVFNLTDNGASATANHVSYVGTGAGDTGGALTVGPDGTVYLTGSTLGTFAGQQRNVQGVSNAFAAALGADGTVQWTQQYGGASGQSTGAGIAIDPEGSSVLDALGLPRGTLDISQSVSLANATTLRTGDSFQVKIDGTAPRTATITIGTGETLTSLVDKINAELGNAGKASVNYSGSTETLSIAANAGQTIELVSGPADSDALGRLGLAAGVLSAPAKDGSSTSSSSTSSSGSGTSSSLPTYGLGLTGGIAGSMDISTKTGADLARSQLLSVLSNIQQAYQSSNTPPSSSTTATTGNTSGTVSSQTTAQLAGYNLALSLLGTSSSDAVNNIATIVAGGTVGDSSSGSSDSDLLSLF